jgi:hypothetical protein
MSWARWHERGYECSSAGDRRFSALFAKLADGRTIEEAYQLDVKGYRVQGNDWHLGKGKAPLSPKTRAELWIEYLDLWRQWAAENSEDFTAIREIAKEKTLTDRFATTEINQAHALSYLVTEADRLDNLPFQF